MSDMGALSHSEATVSCIFYDAEPDRRPIRSIRTLNGRTNKFGWLQAPATKISFLSAISANPATIRIHSAIAEMLKHGESEIKEIIAVSDNKEILSACGRCRELIFQINPRNKNTVVHLSATKRTNISTLLPEPWSIG